MSKRDKNSDASKCGPGEILRKGYHRKGYERRSFERSDGTKVPATYVSDAYVPPTCVPDQGSKGYGPKTLPPLGMDIHLSNYGYSIHKPANERRAALKAATHDYSTLSVLRRLNLIRNYQAVPENKEKFSDDVKYLQRQYANTRRSRPNDPELLSIWEKSQSNRRRGSKSQHGGANVTSDAPVSDIGPTSATSPGLGERALEIEQKVCTNGKCVTKVKIFEAHNVDGKNVVFYNLDENDIDAVVELDKKYIDADQSRDNISERIINNSGRIIGVKVDDVLQGYCLYDIAAKDTAQIIWFTANKGYGKILYLFVERFLKRNGYNRIIVIITLDGAHTINRLNFWYSRGFTAFEDHIADSKQIYVQKYIQ